MSKPDIQTRFIGSNVRIERDGAPVAYIYDRTINDTGEDSDRVYVIHVFDESTTPDGRPLLGVHSTLPRAIADAEEFFVGLAA